MPKVVRKNIGAKQVRKADRTLLQKSSGSTAQNRAPIVSEGAEGQLTVRLVNGQVKLYVKFRGKWYGILLS